MLLAVETVLLAVETVLLAVETVLLAVETVLPVLTRAMVCYQERALTKGHGTNTDSRPVGRKVEDATRCPVLTYPMVLHACYAMPGTERAMLGTEIAYHATRCSVQRELIVLRDVRY
eukprot:1450378-Rhodomonas_salina.1